MAKPITPPSEPERPVELLDYEALTGLPNRALLADRLTVAIAQGQRYKDLVALVVIDLNKPTEVRAALGLEAGEQLTSMVADHLRQFTRKSDTLAYIGSDLFAIVMPRVRSLAQILGLTRHLMKLFDGPWELAGQSLTLVPGVGVAYYPENGAEPAGLVAQAVTAASHAAREGECRPHLVDPAWHAEARERLALENDLRRAIEKEELLLHYQPQVSAQDGRVSGFEALVRWAHPQRGLVAPDDFIPLAEETRLIRPIGTWVVGEACRQLNLWRRAGHGEVRVAVNLAAEQLTDEGLVALVRESLGRHELKPEQLEVEITERTAIAAKDATAGVLEELHALGVRLTLDDFGTGYSSPLLVVQYPFDTLKIDRSFVMRVLDGQRERAVTAAIVALAHGAGMTVVAEGVERRQQLHLLCELGADEIQGYFFSRPLPPSECVAFLQGRCDVEGGGIARGAAPA
jgi:diguanylate cyclase (GGDEF)-like protein